MSISKGRAKLCIIVAASENNAIGKNGDIPWHIPGELKYVKETTWGSPLIMGRKTYESIGRPLPGRTTIVVSSQMSQTKDSGFFVRPDFEAALKLAQDITEAAPQQTNRPQIFVFGGGYLYKETLERQTAPLIERIYLTRVHQVIDGADAFFPDLPPSQWIETNRQDMCGKEICPTGHPPTHSFLILDRAV